MSQIARSIARSLSLNEDLCEAIALGHDLGHTPFGHVGERVLDKLTSCGFQHNVQSLRVVDVLEKDGRGLNLTYEVRDGILQHKISGKPQTLEGKVVSFADRIAYINHDIQDAIRAGILKEEDLPKDAVERLGRVSKERINTAITDIYEKSKNKNEVSMSDEVLTAMNKLRAFMFERVYNLTNKSMQEKSERMLTQMFWPRILMVQRCGQVLLWLFPSLLLAHRGRRQSSILSMRMVISRWSLSGRSSVTDLLSWGCSRRLLRRTRSFSLIRM